MKKLISLICIIIITSQSLIGCSANTNVQFSSLFSQILDFSESDSVPHDAILMISNEDFQKFRSNYVRFSDISMKSLDKEKAVLYLQIPSSTTSVNEYSVKSIKISNDTLIVNLKKSRVISPKVPRGFKGTYKWVMFLEVDKSNLRNDMKIEIKK